MFELVVYREVAGSVSSWSPRQGLASIKMLWSCHNLGMLKIKNRRSGWRGGRSDAQGDAVKVHRGCEHKSPVIQRDYLNNLHGCGFQILLQPPHQSVDLCGQ